MVNNVIKYVRTMMTPDEKALMTTKLLEGFTGDGWASDVIQTVWKDSPRRNTQKLQRMKGLVFDMLAAKYESE